MANISGMNGRGCFVGDWGLADRELFINVINKYLGETYYSTNVEIHDSSTLSFIMWGSGRWTYQTNLEHMPQWLIDGTAHEPKKNKMLHSLINIPEDLMALSKVMYERGLTVEIEFVDEETGCGVFYEENGVIKAYCIEVGEEIVPVSLCYEQSNCKDINITRSDLIKRAGYEEGSFGCSEADVLEMMEFEMGIDMNNINKNLLITILENNPYGDAETIVELYLK